MRTRSTSPGAKPVHEGDVEGPEVANQQEDGPDPSSPEPPRSPDSDSNEHPQASASPIEPIPRIPAPWKVRGDIYSFSLWTSKAKAESMPKHHLFSQLEAHSSFADSESSKPVGGLGSIQILRYKETPVGPYDELVVVPGSYEWERKGPDGRRKGGSNLKISRVYVSQKHTCYNGRLNWNVPKHLARFDWQYDPNGVTTVRVFPHDVSGDPHEPCPSPEPFFQATFKPVRFAPRFPFATEWVAFLGLDTTLVMPPLPAGSGSQGELPGTDRWCSFLPHQYSRRTALGWFDMAQREGNSGRVLGEYENFLPGLGRWQFGVLMEDAELTFHTPLETWEGTSTSSGSGQITRAKL
ncbi:hypothetical protein ESCO_001239 [Escovopsis weberi]|uniref:Uncharacterized protein n=1 Tax=Escovopsis weberi TaxID=150374 RepID=A0A0M8MYV8_ESCWE|nr:hypothetical protein ESCO_001239 [Escovopsis weberi]